MLTASGLGFNLLHFEKTFPYSLFYGQPNLHSLFPFHDFLKLVLALKHLDLGNTNNFLSSVLNLFSRPGPS